MIQRMMAVIAALGFALLAVGSSDDDEARDEAAERCEESRDEPSR
jgi:hypothetical protein